MLHAWNAIDLAEEKVLAVKLSTECTCTNEMVIDCWSCQMLGLRDPLSNLMLAQFSTRTSLTTSKAAESTFRLVTLLIESVKLPAFDFSAATHRDSRRRDSTWLRIVMSLASLLITDIEEVLNVTSLTFLISMRSVSLEQTK